MANAQNRFPVLWGMLPNIVGAFTSAAVNNAPNWLAQSFTIGEARNVTSFHAYVASVVGTPAAANLTLDIYGDTAGTGPSTSQGTSPAAPTGSNISAGNVTGAGWLTWDLSSLNSGSGVVLTNPGMYWGVLKSSDANTVNYQYGPTNTAMFEAGGSGSNYGWCVKASTNSGGAWTSKAISSIGWRVGFSDGSYAGIPITSMGAASNNLAHGATEFGVRFQTPANAQLKVKGVSAYVNKFNSPTGNFSFKIYPLTGAPALGQTQALAPAYASGAEVVLEFSPAVTLSGGTQYYLTLVDSLTDSSTNAYRFATDYIWDADANSATLVPFDGSAVVATTINSGTNFTTSAGTVFPVGLLLDTNGEFAAGGGSALLTHPGMSGGMRG